MSGMEREIHTALSILEKGEPPMATTCIMPLHIGKGRTESRAISKIIDYVANPQKTDHGRLITGYECDSRVVDAQFMLAKRMLAMQNFSEKLTSWSSGF